MKKRISLLLALVMMVTFLPTSVFAKAEYRVDRTPSVSDSHQFDGGAMTPRLTVTPKDAIVNGQTFRLSLENAEFNDEGGNFLWGATETFTNCSFDIRRISSTVIELTYAGSAIGIDQQFAIPMKTRVVSAGDVKVIIDPRDSVLSSGTYTYAIAGSGETMTTVSSTKDLQDTSTTLEDIIIDEIRPGTIKSGAIRFRAPSGFTFTNGPAAGDVIFSGGFNPAVDKCTAVDIAADGDEIVFTITATPTTSRGTITIPDVQVKPEDTAKYGDIYLTVSGTSGVTRDSFLVGTYKEYGISFVAENKTLPVLLAGRFEGSAVDNRDADQYESAETLMVSFKENVTQSWWQGRKTEITIPEGVKFRAVQIKNAKNVTPNPNDTYYNDGTTVNGVTVDNNKITLTGFSTTGTDKKASMDFVFWVSVEPGFEGDLGVTLTGPAVAEDITATVGTVISPITVEARSTDVRIGYAGVSVNDITIIENEPGAILKRVYGGSGTTDTAPLQLWAHTTNVGLDFANVDSYEITSGDIEIDKINASNGVINIYVKRESSKPSTIVLKGVTMNIDRTVPEGSFPIRVGGRAIISNFSNDYTDSSRLLRSMFSTSHYRGANFYNVVTSAPDKTSTLTVEAVINILETPNMIMCSDGTTITMPDAEAYIENGRTMIPVAYIAAALGIPASNVIWDNNLKTVTIMRNNYVAQLQENSSIILVNGSRITMNTSMVIRNNRSYVPIAYVAMALGVPYEWDDAAKTVRFNPLNTTASSSVQP